MRLFTDALAVARRAQDRIPLLISLYDLALARQAQGDLPAAAGHLQEELALAADAEDETTAAYYLEALAARRTAEQPATCRAPARRRPLDPGSQRQRMAARLRAAHDDAALPAWRSRIGQAAFEEAQAWGKSASSKRAVEYALQQT